MRGVEDNSTAMASSSSSSFACRFNALPFLLLLSFVAVLHFDKCEAQLSPTFYDDSCPNVSAIVREQLLIAQSSDRRIFASLTRLFFHDCFTDVTWSSLLFIIRLISWSCWKSEYIYIYIYLYVSYFRDATPHFCWMTPMEFRARSLLLQTTTRRGVTRSSTLSKPPSRAVAPELCLVLTS